MRAMGEAPRAHRSLEFRGSVRAPGMIGWLELVRLVDTLRATADTAARFVVTGSGARRGPSPDWLRKLVDFELTELPAAPRSSN